MNNKRVLHTTSPDHFDNNKKRQTMEHNSGDVFSWDRLSQLMDVKLVDVARKSDLLEVNTQIEELREENRQLKDDIKKLSSRLELIDRKSRAASIVVGGLNSNNIHTAKAEFIDICLKLLEVHVNVLSVRILSKKMNFLFNLESTVQVNNIMAAKGKLQGVPVYIQKDYTEEEQSTRYNLRMISKSISKKDATIKVRLGEFCIFVENKKYTWSKGNVVAYCSNDADFLLNILEKCGHLVEVVVRNNLPDKASLVQ